MNSKTPNSSKKNVKKATGSRNGAVRAKTTKDAKRRTHGAHGATPATSDDPDTTLTQLAEAYLKHLEETGKSPSTLFSYRMDLGIAQTHFGEKTEVGTLTPETVGEFFESDAVTKRKSGKNKTEVTIKKTRRVLRMALVWAAETGLIAEAPIPTTAATTKD